MSIVLEVVYESRYSGDSRYIISDEVDHSRETIYRVRGEAVCIRDGTNLDWDYLVFDMSHSPNERDSKGCTRQELI